MTDNRPIVERIKHELPPRRHALARARYIGKVATELAGERAAGLPFDDAAQPSRWKVAPAYTVRGLEHLARTRRTQDVIAAFERAQEHFDEASKDFNRAAEDINPAHQQGE